MTRSRIKTALCFAIISLAVLAANVAPAGVFVSEDKYSMGAATAQETAYAREIIKALAEADYQAFITNGDDSLKTVNEAAQFKAVCIQVQPRLKNGYHAVFLGGFNRKNYHLTTWEIAYNDGGDDDILRLQTRNGKICGAAIHKSTSPSESEVRNILRECMDKQQRAPEMVIGLIDRNGTRVIAYGKCKRGEAAEVNGNMLFEIGSITKVFTTLLLQEMVDDGEVKLDDPIGKFLPPSVKTPARNGKQITLLDLATHTSGLPRDPDNLSPKDGDNPYADYTAAQMYDFLSHYKLTRDVGSKFEYSNFGMGLLGHLLELKAGSNYESLIISRICNPLDMDSTRITLSPELKSRLATGHSSAGPPVENWDLPTVADAGALRSSVNDLLKFLAANMGKTGSPLYAAMAKTQMPQRRVQLFVKIGLGWIIVPAFDLTFHNGGTEGYTSYLGFDSEGDGVVILANESTTLDDVGLHLLGLGHVRNLKAPKQRSLVSINKQVYADYIGRYQLLHWPIPIRSKQFVTVTRDGDRLRVQESDDFPYQMLPESPTDFFLTDEDAQVTFVRNKARIVTRLILTEDGAKSTAIKIQ